MSIALLALSGSAFAMPVWINEIHYDNTGGDAGEFTEIAGSSGTDLSGYELIFYNGNGGGTYNSINLSGIIADQSNGFGVLAFFVPGIQNGSPDGIALKSSAGELQFLSYEGSITATNGAATGQQSTDIGVFEPGSTPAGQSLQLTGYGSTYSDFSWTGPSAESPGTINLGQSFAREAVPDQGSTTLLLGLGLTCLALIRRKQRVVGDGGKGSVPPPTS